MQKMKCLRKIARLQYLISIFTRRIMPILIMVRHGQSTWNLENRFTGDVDVDLTPLGEEEAKKAGRLLKTFHLDKAYSSVLKRAIHTLDIILKETGNGTIPVTKSPALNERNYGDLQGLNKTDIEKKYGVSQVLLWRRSFDVAPPHGESLKNTYDRVVPYYTKEIAPDLRGGKNVLVVAHGNSLRALMMYLENISQEEIVNLNLATGVPKLYDLDNALHVAKTYYVQ
jgi:2,3-bisphosphoglycerate-dependent phosphoglycerate mutase